MTRTRRAVVVGSGPNGLVAANLLADAGLDVLVLEAEPAPGGAVRSGDDVAPGFVHDTFSSFYPLGAVSPVLQRLRLEQHGLRWSHAPAVLGHPRPDGSWAVLHRDRAHTAAAFERATPGDGEAWLALCAEWDRFGPGLVASLLSPFPPVRGGVRLLAGLARTGGLARVREWLTPVVDVADRRFAGDGPGLLLAGNALHADIGLSAPGSMIFALMLTMVGQTHGFPVPQGGAGRLTDALVSRLRASGGVLRTGAPVTSIMVDRRRATGVAVGAERIAADVVIADVSAPALYGRLVAWDALPARTRRGMAGFAWDPATIKVDFALDGPVPWAGAPAAAPGTVHLGGSVGDLVVNEARIRAGRIPARPFLLCGQLTTADPTRSPAGTEAFWAYAHVPQRVRADEGGDLTGTWDADERERLADRIQAEVERWAPGFGSTVRARRALGPRELESRNRNLVGGALGGGTATLSQQLVFRPVPGLGRAETPVRGLFLGSASAHPGGGVHGAPGANAARAALAALRLRRL